MVLFLTVQFIRIYSAKDAYSFSTGYMLVGGSPPASLDRRRRGLPPTNI